MGVERPVAGGTGSSSAAGRAVPIDLNRAIVFPNRLREQRRRLGFAKLLRLSEVLPDIPYIRLSKIERGEVVARADELRRIAAALGIEPEALLIDVDAPSFDLDQWAQPSRDASAADLAGERFAVLLGAALRARRATDPELTIAVLDEHYGLPPVNLSRVENAAKTFERWNAATQRALFAIFGVSGEAGLRALVERQHREGLLDAMVPLVSDPAARIERTRARVRELAQMLARARSDDTAPAAAGPAPQGAGAKADTLLEVRGGSLRDGLISDTPTGATIAAPPGAGPRAFGLCVARATLGAGLPVRSVIIADPDRPPAPGGLAALREEQGWRILSVGASRDGQRIGYSLHPEHEVPLDDCDPERLAGVVSATFP